MNITIKILKKTLADWILHSKKIVPNTLVGFILEIERWFNISQEIIQYA